jgi:hypothetical protein
MQAISFTDHYLKNHPRVEVCTLQLVGISSVILSVKLNEDRYMSMEQGAMECGGCYTTEMIEKIEKSILYLLQFRTNIPTPIDFIQYFLILSNKEVDFSDMILECRSYAYVSLLGKYSTLLYSFLVYSR